MAGLDDSLKNVVGGRTATVMAKSFGMHTVEDLLAHYPRRYAERGELTAIAELPLNESITIVAEVKDVRERSMASRKGSILEVRITDGRGTLVLTFFNQPWRSAELRPGVRGIFAGKVGEYRGVRQLAHPDYELLPGMSLEVGTEEAKRWAEVPIPIYPASSTLASWQIAKAVGVVLDGLEPLADPIPAEIRAQRGLMDYTQAIIAIHRPERAADWRAARSTLRFHEAFVLQAALLQRRAALRDQLTEPRLPTPGGLLERFDAALPFALTGDQKVVGTEIAADLAAASPMNRLIQGEVGSGKTLVALRAMLAVADSGGQSAFLAPTEVLASQHLRSIVAMLGPTLSAELMPSLLTGQLSTAERRKALLWAVSGQSRLIVGTHALLGDAVDFFDLGLIVVDEQHRFGVDQREALRLKGRNPHVLVLTATPIPRTVAMTVFGDLDTSIITELPPGRPGIESFAVPLTDHPAWGERIWTRVAEELELGRQAFVVCPAIDRAAVEDPAEAPGESGDDVDLEQAEGAAPIATVADTIAMLRDLPVLAGRRIEPLHGRMSSDDKDRTMRAFASGDIDVLVATTVIEVGVDVPNASTMVVMDADRFGVSQLHQLRGRVGRGSVPGLALFVTRATTDTLARQRVEAVAATLDGFELAQVDLELRREGNVLGTDQSGGRSSLRLLRVVKDTDLITDARSLAAGIIDSDPHLQAFPALAAAIARRLDDAERDYLSKA